MEEEDIHVEFLEEDILETEPETTPPPFKYELKNKLNNILHSSSFCCLCLNTELKFSKHDDLINICEMGEPRKVSLTHIIRNLFRSKISPPISDLICSNCKREAMNAYKFIENISNTYEIINNYINQMKSKISHVKNVDNSENDLTKTLIVLENPVIKKSAQLNTKNYSHTEIFTCQLCNIEFSKAGLIRHYKIKHGAMPPNMKKTCSNNQVKKCFECSTSTCKHMKYLVNFELQKRVGNKNTVCIDCDYVTDNTRSLIEHVNIVHLENYPHICEFCGEKFAIRYKYTNHIGKYHKDIHQCVYCECKYYSNIENLDKHMETCRNILRKYKCDKCPASFDRQNQLETHEGKHNSIYNCNLCNATFDNEELSKVHRLTHNKKVQRIKNKTLLHMCWICSKKFLSADDYKTHIAIHNSGEHFCTICNKKFASRTQFLVHTRRFSHKVKLDPTATRDLKCATCDFSTSDKNHLESHTNRFHNKITPYSCEKCPKNFTNRVSLKNHLLTHEKTKTHQCDICKNRFSGSVALKRHKLSHLSEKPYKCDLCDHKYATSIRLNEHLKSNHSSDTYTQCPICQRGYQTVKQMRFHFKLKHWDSTEPFDVNKCEGLTKEEKELFRDKRLVVV